MESRNSDQFNNSYWKLPQSIKRSTDTLKKQVEQTYDEIGGGMENDPSVYEVENIHVKIHYIVNKFKLMFVDLFINDDHVDEN